MLYSTSGAANYVNLHQAPLNTLKQLSLLPTMKVASSTSQSSNLKRVSIYNKE